MAVTRIEKTNPEYGRADTMTLTLQSTNLNRRQDVSVYNAYSTQKDLPIVILLHGVYGNHWVWMDMGGAHLVYDSLRQQGLTEFVLVMPSDGGLWEGSGYLPIPNQGDYDKWIVEDVLQGVLESVDSVSDKSNLYISGLSMGGYGTLRLGAKYAHKFKGISAHSSITKVEDLALFVETPIENYQTADSSESDIVYWCQKNKDILPPIRFDCGKDDQLFESNQTLVSQLELANIVFEYQTFEGGHEWPYWHEHLKDTLRFFNEIETNVK